jgi:sensor histidine kinase YesM
VRAERRSDVLVIEVRDDGGGFTPGERQEGVGLGNTRARLAELYGARQHVEVMSAEGEGTCVRLTIPCRMTGVEA